jgi:hypothetical protein
VVQETEAKAARKEIPMSLLIITHILLGIIGVFVGVLIAGKRRDHGDIHEADSDERLADFYTVRI